MITYGPGTLLIGSAGAEVDYSVKVNSLRLTTSADTSDPTTKLNGTQFPGTTTFSGELGGNADIDPDEDDGLFQLASEFAGTVQSFQFMPNDVAKAEARGLFTIMPLDFGADTYGDALTSDFTWSTLGDIEFWRDGTLAWTQKMSPRSAVLPAAPPAATGATAGTPGTWTPANSKPPASVATIGAVTASPATLWTVGQFVQTGTAGTAGEAHWNGSAWTAGKAPTE